MYINGLYVNVKDRATHMPLTRLYAMKNKIG